MNRVTVLTKWTNDTGVNVADVVRYPGAWTDDTGQSDDQITPDPNVVVFYGEVDGPVVDALEADNNVIVLAWEEITELAPQPPETPFSAERVAAHVDAQEVQDFIAERTALRDAMKEEAILAAEASATPQTLPTIPPKAPDANPTASERTKLVSWLNAQGVTGTDRAALVRAGVSRKTIADDIREWAKSLPRKGGA